MDLHDIRGLEVRSELFKEVSIIATERAGELSTFMVWGLAAVIVSTEFVNACNQLEM